MSKSKRLIDLMMTVNRMRKFTVRELADQFGVSSRTILRDLQELSELGSPLFRGRTARRLPGAERTGSSADRLQRGRSRRDVFASHALRHYLFLPFEAESSTALQKFYYYMPGDVRDRIDQMKNRVDFLTHTRQQKAESLGALLDAAVDQRVVTVLYESRKAMPREASSPWASMQATASGIVPLIVFCAMISVCSAATACSPWLRMQPASSRGITAISIWGTGGNTGRRNRSMSGWSWI